MKADANQITEAMRPRPVKPMRTLDANVQQTAREYADHLNMMLDYYIDLSKWQDEMYQATCREWKEAFDAKDAACQQARSSQTASGELLREVTDSLELGLETEGEHEPDWSIDDRKLIAKCRAILAKGEQK